MSGIIGTKNLKYSLIGEDVVTAAKMEASGRPDHIHASEDLAHLLPTESWERSRVVKTTCGRTLETYILAVE